MKRRRPLFITRLWPRNLAGQLMVLLLLALALAQVVGAVILFDEHRLTLASAKRGQVLGRIVAIARVLSETPAQMHERILNSASTVQLRFWISPDSVINPTLPKHQNNSFSKWLTQLLNQPADRPVYVSFEETSLWNWQQNRSDEYRRWMHDRDSNDDDDDDDEAGHFKTMNQLMQGRQMGRFRQSPELSVSLQLSNDMWFNATYRTMAVREGWAYATMLTLALMAFAVCAVTFLMVRRITRPLAELATAADALGRGEDGPALIAKGPLEIQSTTQAFNQMRERLQRFVKDRTRMLAAISHDLRSPLTSLRLRAEMLEDGESREKILETLEEMQRMTEATLAFAREDANKEETRAADMCALIESITLDQQDMGQDVSFKLAHGTPDSLPYRCRPFALKRAIRNLIENAVRYGTCARVELITRDQSIHITIEDDGPGIPADKLDHVFEPFVRLEESRNLDTGGMGLGLAIARNIIRSHGGDIHLENRPDCGLCVRAILPMAFKGTQG